MERNRENCIEWMTGQDTLSVSLTQQKYITKVRKMKQKYPDLVTIVENSDGSIWAKMPLKALKLSIITSNNNFKKEDEDGQSTT